MPGTPQALASAARNAFTKRTGTTCHDAVLEWLEDSEYVPNNAHERLFADVGGRPPIYGQILVSYSDPRVMTIAGANALPMGTIIGFWGEGELKHSIIVVSPTILAGANNTGVWDPDAAAFPIISLNLRAIFLTSQLMWSPNSTVGKAGYTMHYQAPREVADRINNRLNLLAPGSE